MTKDHLTFRGTFGGWAGPWVGVEPVGGLIVGVGDALIAQDRLVLDVEWQTEQQTTARRLRREQVVSPSPPQSATGSSGSRLGNARGPGAVTARPRRRITVITTSVDRDLLSAEALVLRALLVGPRSPFPTTEVAGRHCGLLDQ